MATLFTILGIAAIVGIDQVLKYCVVLYLQPIGQTQAFLGVIRLHYTENTGAAFSLFSGSTTVLTVLTGTILLVCLLLLLTKKLKPLFLHICVAAITAGGLGNLIDRVARGFVVDYIEPVFIQFAIFNFADCFVSVGASMMLAYLFWDLYKEWQRKKQQTGGV